MNNKNKKKKSIRLKYYDYSIPDDCFITICTHNRKCIFGYIKNGKIILNDLGRMVREEIINTQKIRKNVFIGVFYVMPNHIHMVISIIGNDCDNNCRGDSISYPENCRGTARRAPTVEQFGKPTINSIPTIIRSIKSAVSNVAHKIGYNSEIWQRNYYEHIIRNQKSYDEIYNYIISNPGMWDRDRNNPNNLKNN